MNKIVAQLVIPMVLLWLLPSCKSSGMKGTQPFGVLYVNNGDVNGGVESGGVTIYYLFGINAGQQYLVRTMIAPGGDLTADVYTSFEAYKLGEAAIASSTKVASAAFPDQIYPDQIYYEVPFTAPSDGIYVVVLKGTPAKTAAPDVNTLYFYDLRIMSASGSALTSFGNAAVDPVSGATATGIIEPGELLVYSGETITPPGTYSILLTTSTYTISYPQVFVYQDNSLSLTKLLYSAISVTYTDPTTSVAAMEFQVSSFSTAPTLTLLSTVPSFTCKIDNVPFTSATGSGPYIMLKGVSEATYTLQVGP